MIRTVLAGLFLVLTGQPLHAQTIELNDWRFLIRDFPDNRLAWQLGSPAHQPDGAYYEHLGNFLYPGGNTVGELDFICLPANGGLPYDLDRADADFWLQQARETVHWYGNSGFQSIGSQFNIVPDVMYRGRIMRDGSYADDFIPTGRMVNLLVCSESGYVSVNRVDSRLQSNKLEIGPGTKYLARHLPVKQSTLAHAFSHVYQNTKVPARRLENGPGTAADGLLDGAAEATAARFVFDQHGGLQATLSRPDISAYGDPFSRRFFMLRPYNVPLQVALPPATETTADSPEAEQPAGDLAEAVEARTAGLYGHQTGGFYYHVIERYLDNIPGRLTTLYELIGLQEAQNIYPALDAFLDRVDGTAMKGLEHVLPQFLAEYAEWWAWRTAGRIPENMWLNTAFGGCRRIVLDEQNAVGMSEVEIPAFAGSCFDVVLGGDLPNRTPELEMLVTSQNGEARSFYMGLARATGLDSGLVSCHQVAEQSRPDYAAPCLLIPMDGNVNPATGHLQVGAARAFHLGPMLANGSEDVVLRLVLAHIPVSMAVASIRETDSIPVRLTVGVDSTAIEGPGVPRAVGGEEPFSATGPLAVSAEGRLRPQVRENIRITGLERIAGIMQEFADIMPSSGPAGRDAWPEMFVVSTNTDGDQSLTLSLAPSATIEPGQTGVVDAEGAIRVADRAVGSQQADRPSRLEILQNDPDLLRYRAEIHMCVEDLPGTSGLRATGGEAQCSNGQPVTFSIESTIAFPGLLPDSATGPSGFTSLPRTTRYVEYRNLRASSSRRY